MHLAGARGQRLGAVRIVLLEGEHGPERQRLVPLGRPERPEVRGGEQPRDRAIGTRVVMIAGELQRLCQPGMRALGIRLRRHAGARSCGRRRRMLGGAGGQGQCAQEDKDNSHAVSGSYGFRRRPRGLNASEGSGAYTRPLHRSLPQAGMHKLLNKMGIFGPPPVHRAAPRRTP